MSLSLSPRVYGCGYAVALTDPSSTLVHAAMAALQISLSTPWRTAWISCTHIDGIHQLSSVARVCMCVAHTSSAVCGMARLICSRPLALMQMSPQALIPHS